MLTFLFAVYRESNLQFLLGREVLYLFRQIIWIVPYLSSSDNGRRLLSAYLPRVLQRFATISSSSLPQEAGRSQQKGLAYFSRMYRCYVCFILHLCSAPRPALGRIWWGCSKLILVRRDWMEMNILGGVCVCVCVCVYGTHKCINLPPDDLISCINHFDTLFCCQNPSHGHLDVLFWFHSPQSLQSSQRKVEKAMVVFLF